MWLAVFLVLFADQTANDRELVKHYSRDARSREASKRAGAAESLGNLKTAEAVDLLVTLLGDKEREVRKAAASALWEAAEVSQKAMPALRKALADDDPAVVMRAAGALINMDVPVRELTDPLREVLATGLPDDRYYAARALIGTDAPGTLVDAILRRVRSTVSSRDSHKEARETLIALARKQDVALRPRLLRELEESPETAPATLRAMGQYQKKPSRWTETLTEQLGSRSIEVQETALALLRDSKSNAAQAKGWAPVVAKLVGDSNPDIRRAAIRALEAAGGLAHAGFDALLRALKADRDAQVRLAAAEAVGKVGDAAFAIEPSLKKRMGEEALPVLRQIIAADPSVEVRRAALRSANVLQIAEGEIIPLLASTAARSDDRETRIAALQALFNRGNAAAGAAATIEPLTRHADESTRTMAVDTLRVIQDKQAPGRSRRGSDTATPADPAARDAALEYLRSEGQELNEEAFYRALSESHLERVKAFLDAGLSPNHRFPAAFNDPVLRVAVEGNACPLGVRPTPARTKEILKLLLARGANPNSKDDHGNTALMQAAQQCDAEVVKLLLKAGADMQAKNAAGLTAFEFGLWGANDGAAALVEAGFRLPADKVQIYREGYKGRAATLALLEKAAAKK